MGEIFEQADLFREYSNLVFEELAAEEPIDIGCVVTGDYVFDCLILCESLKESWSFYPFRLHVFVYEEETRGRLAELDLPEVEVRLLDRGPAATWREGVRRKISLVEDSGLDRCIVTDNVFVSETPELWYLLDRYDFVFAGGPVEKWPIQPSLWAFRKGPRSVRFSRDWYRHSEAGRLSEASGLPFALLESRDGL